MDESSYRTSSIKTIFYHFQFPDKSGTKFVVHLNQDTLSLTGTPLMADPPAWTTLEFYQCPNCPLDKRTNPFCPIAYNITDLEEFFCHQDLQDSVLVTVETPERTYVKNTNIQHGLFSLLGIYMVSSGCPIMDKLRPMVRFHMPFVTIEELTCRAIGMYLFAQSYLWQQGISTDWNLKGLMAVYEKIEEVNNVFIQRLRRIDRENSTLAAIEILDSFAYYINLSLEGSFLYDIEYLFQDHFPQQAPAGRPLEKPAEELHYQYHFRFDNGQSADFDVALDGKLLHCLSRPSPPYPAWTALDNHRCRNCPLSEKGHSHCPVAVNIADLINAVKDFFSFEQATVTVQTTDRTYTKYVSVSAGISSLMGIYMVSSGCPLLGKLKPMVRFHLPFASLEETVYRAVCMYLMSQYFLQQKGTEPDWDIASVSKIYDPVNVVNEDFCERLKSIHIEDASINALIKLDCFSKTLHGLSAKKLYDKYRPSFSSYWDA